MKSLLQYINALSIDVCLGAVASALFFSRFFNVSIRPAGLFSLGLTVWIIYSVDHLLDAKRISHRASTFRHRFYQQHYKAWLIVTIAAIGIDVFAILWIRRPVFLGGILLFAAVLTYLLLNRFWRIPKEPIIALFYSFGVLLPSIAVTSIPFEAWPLSIMFQFFSTALLNLVIFAWFDRHHDKEDDLPSFVTQFGPIVSRMVIWAIFTINLLLSLLAFPAPGQMILLIMNLTLGALFYFEEFFTVSERFRIVGDAVFLIPFVWAVR